MECNGRQPCAGLVSEALHGLLWPADVPAKVEPKYLSIKTISACLMNSLNTPGWILLQDVCYSRCWDCEAVVLRVTYTVKQ